MGERRGLLKKELAGWALSYCAQFANPHCSRWPWLGAVAAIAVLEAASPTAWAATLGTWQFDPIANQFTFVLPAGAKPTHSLLDDPPRIVLYLPESQLAGNAIERSFPGTVQQVRIVQFDPETVRIVLELAPGTALEAEQIQLEQAGTNESGQARWTLQLPKQAATSVATTAPPNRQSETAAATPPADENASATSSQNRSARPSSQAQRLGLRPLPAAIAEQISSRDDRSAVNRDLGLAAGVPSAPATVPSASGAIAEYYPTLNVLAEDSAAPASPASAANAETDETAAEPASALPPAEFRNPDTQISVPPPVAATNESPDSVAAESDSGANTVTETEAAAIESDAPDAIAAKPPTSQSTTIEVTPSDPSLDFGDTPAIRIRVDLPDSSAETEPAQPSAPPRATRPLARRPSSPVAAAPEPTEIAEETSESETSDSKAAENEATEEAIAIADVAIEAEPVESAVDEPVDEPAAIATAESINAEGKDEANDTDAIAIPAELPPAKFRNPDVTLTVPPPVEAVADAPAAQNEPETVDIEAPLPPSFRGSARPPSVAVPSPTELIQEAATPVVTPAPVATPAAVPSPSPSRPAIPPPRPTIPQVQAATERAAESSTIEPDAIAPAPASLPVAAQPPFPVARPVSQSQPTEQPTALAPVEPAFESPAAPPITPAAQPPFPVARPARLPAAAVEPPIVLPAATPAAAFPVPPSEIAVPPVAALPDTQTAFPASVTVDPPPALSASPTPPPSRLTAPPPQTLARQTAPPLPKPRVVSIPPPASAPVTRPVPAPTAIAAPRRPVSAIPVSPFGSQVIERSQPLYPTATDPTNIGIVAFGQPLPGVAATTPATNAIAATNSAPGQVLLPAGTVLTLRYPGPTTLALQPNRPRQEILLLHQAVRDRAGAILFPAGTRVAGRFQSTQAGSQFVTQAIVRDNRAIPLSGQSAILPSSQYATGIPPNQVLQIRLNQPTLQP